MTAILGSAVQSNDFINEIDLLLPLIFNIPLKEMAADKPFLDNYFFGAVDAVVLGAMMKKIKPKRIVEIGSGISTRYMKFFKDRFNLETQIVCIDPEPRAEINGVADIIVRKPFESVIEAENLLIDSGDFLFMDGSHYVFQNNDSLSFFFKVLPSLPLGVIIHIHDIYLPDDYSENVAEQLWGEQYILAAMLISGLKGYKVLFPTFYINQSNSAFKAITEKIDSFCRKQPFKLRKNHREGYSFWMEKTGATS